MRHVLKEVFIVLVCRDDGAVVLTFEEFQQVVRGGEDAAQWVSAARNRGQMYLIKGSDGKLAFKIGKDEFSEKISGPLPFFSNSVQGLVAASPRTLFYSKNGTIFDGLRPGLFSFSPYGRTAWVGLGARPCVLFAAGGGLLLQLSIVLFGPFGFGGQGSAQEGPCASSFFRAALCPRRRS